MNNDRIWVLGAADPEMNLIENLLRECGEHIEYATVHRNGVSRRVTPGEAYGDDVEIGDGLRGLSVTAYMVECAPYVLDGPSVDWAGVAYSIDHHRPGDPGYGRPPSEFLPASSIGQVLSVLRRHFPAFFDAGEWITSDGGEPRDVGGFVVGMPYADIVPPSMVLAAAADHCLPAAYRGECPGVDPDALMRWRAETRAAFQGRSVEDILADVERGRHAVRQAPLVSIGFDVDAPGCAHHRGYADPGCGDCDYEGGALLVRDLRHAYTVSTVLVSPFAEGATVDSAGVGDSRTVVFGPRDEGAWDEGGHHTSVRRGVPELPEAATREGVAYLATVVERDGRQKIVLGGHTTPETVRAFMDQWAPAHGLVGIYGDPARGFAGGYLTREEADD